MIVNRHRGEVSIVINGAEHPMRLTLGALAALEDRIESGSLVALVERFETGTFKSEDLILLIWAGLNGAGIDISVEEVGACRLEGGPIAAAKAATALLSATFGGDST